MLLACFEVSHHGTRDCLWVPLNRDLPFELPRLPPMANSIWALSGPDRGELLRFTHPFRRSASRLDRKLYLSEFECP